MHIILMFTWIESSEQSSRTTLYRKLNLKLVQYILGGIPHENVTLALSTAT